MEKMAKLVTVEYTVRVIVDSDATEQDIVRVAIPKIIESVKNETFENLVSISKDREAPFGKGLNDNIY